VSLNLLFWLGLHYLVGLSILSGFALVVVLFVLGDIVAKWRHK